MEAGGTATREKEAQGAGRGRASCIVGVDAVGTEGWLPVLGRASCVGGAGGLPEGGEGTFWERQGDGRRGRSGAGKTGIRKNQNQNENKENKENEKTRKAEGRKETYTHVPHYCWLLVWLLVFQQSKTGGGERKKKKGQKKKTKKTEEKAKTEKTEIRKRKGVWGVECEVWGEEEILFCPRDV